MEFDLTEQHVGLFKQLSFHVFAETKIRGDNLKSLIQVLGGTVLSESAPFGAGELVILDGCPDVPEWTKTVTATDVLRSNYVYQSITKCSLQPRDFYSLKQQLLETANDIVEINTNVNEQDPDILENFSSDLEIISSTPEAQSQSAQQLVSQTTAPELPALHTGATQKEGNEWLRILCDNYCTFSDEISANILSNGSIFPSYHETPDVIRNSVAEKITPGSTYPKITATKATRKREATTKEEAQKYMTYFEANEIMAEISGNNAYKNMTHQMDGINRTWSSIRNFILNTLPKRISYYSKDKVQEQLWRKQFQGISKQTKSRKKNYSREDGILLLDIIRKAGAYEYIGGNLVFEEIAHAKFFPGRGYSSIKEFFRKKVLRNHKHYNCSDEEFKLYSIVMDENKSESIKHLPASSEVLGKIANYTC